MDITRPSSTNCDWSVSNRRQEIYLPVVKSENRKKLCVITGCVNNFISGFAACKQCPKVLAFISHEMDFISAETLKKLQWQAAARKKPKNTTLTACVFNHEGPVTGLKLTGLGRCGLVR